jgi:hypothetical protein
VGEIPVIAGDILDRLRAEQQADSDGGVDYVYNITADLGETLVGFRHDQDVEIDDPEPFQVLGDPPKPAAWWQVWKR